MLYWGDYLNYPDKVARKITKQKTSLRLTIDKNVARLYVANMDEHYDQQQREYEQEPLRYLEIAMEYPIKRGREPSQHYVDRLLNTLQPMEIFQRVTQGYEAFNYFKKEHCFIALCHLYNLAEKDTAKHNIKSFLLKKVVVPISSLNKAESVLLRIVRKLTVIHTYPKLREEIAKKLENLPEIEKFVKKPTAQQYTFSNELTIHDQYFKALLKLNSEQLGVLINTLLEYESSLEENFVEAKEKIPSGEREINGLEWAGSGDKIYTLKNIMCNFHVISSEERDHL